MFCTGKEKTSQWDLLGKINYVLSKQRYTQVPGNKHFLNTIFFNIG